MKSIMLCCVLLLCACGSQFGRQIEDRFPSRNELVELSQSTKTATYLKNKQPGKRVDTWKLTGPLPSQLGESTAVPTTPFEIVLAQNVDRAPTLNMTDAMNCVAREYAIFHTTHSAPPFQSLQRFIETRCGSVAPNVQTITLDTGTATAVDALASRKSQIEEYVKQFADFSTNVNAGIAYSKLPERSVIIIAYEQPSIKITPTSIRSQSGMFVVEGKLQNGKVPERFDARFTKGDFDTDNCKGQPVEPPAFKFVCTLEPTDLTTYLQISYQMKDALFANTAGRILVFPGEVSDTYLPPKTRRILTASNASTKKETMLETINDLINRVRTSAGRTPIAGHVAQSESLQQLAPVFFESSSDSAKLNKVIMGMMAGWEINDEIVNADFTSSYIDTTDPAQLVESALETPGGRSTLLSPSASAFGFGAISNAEQGMGSVFVSYDFVQEEHSNKRIKRVVAALNRERESYGMKAIKENKSTRYQAENWAKDLEAGASIEDVSADLMDAFLEKTGKQQVRSYMMLVPDLDKMTFPGSIINKNKLEASFVVAPYKPLNSPWTFYAVILAY